MATSSHDASPSSSLNDIRELYKLRKVTPSTRDELCESFQPSDREMAFLQKVLSKNRPALVRMQHIDSAEFSDSAIISHMKNLLDSNPGQFLYQFGKSLDSVDLELFQDSQCATVRFLVDKLTQGSKITDSTAIRNRRYKKLQELLDSGEYFSLDEMEKRQPALYYQHIGRFETESQRKTKTTSRMKWDPKFSTFLLNQSDREDMGVYRDRYEESDSDSDEEQMAFSERVDAFTRLMKERFLEGKDTGMYENVDDNEAYDDLTVLSRDQEEAYFDDDATDDAKFDPPDDNDFNPPPLRPRTLA